NFLHDQVEEGSILPISAPAGDFVLKEDNRPLILISGGVGLTPMMSMLETSIKNNPEREVVFIHAARNGGYHAMKNRVKEKLKHIMLQLIRFMVLQLQKMFVIKKDILTMNGSHLYYQQMMQHSTSVVQKDLCKQ